MLRNFVKFAKLMQMSKAHDQKTKHVGRFGDCGKIGKFDEFDKILPNSQNCQTYANEQNSAKPNMFIGPLSCAHSPKS